MYESHFGFSGTPFSLNPDPSFYFQSKGHGNALSYLRFGVYQSEGFVVVTGEIGAGKTTMVRTLLSELDEQKIVAAQIVSTQLEAGELLRSVAIAFGVAPKNLSKAELIASIEAFLTLLVTQEKRALLIVDEAQNLNLQAIEELRMLSNFQLGNRALLQSFLVGQPELRQLLTSKPMEQFRQRVIASCHLGGMDVAETLHYIEHRLRKVGWAGNPAFEPAAFERIHHWTGGIPRRINLLCNRLLLSVYLKSGSTICASDVDLIAGEVLAEVGESKAHLSPLDAPVAPTEPIRMVAGERMRPPASDRPRRRGESRRPTPQQVGPVLCIATDGADDIKLAAMMVAMQRREDAPSLVLVRLGDPTRFIPNDAFHQGIGLEVPVVDIAIGEATASLRIAESIQAFEPVFALHEPSAVVVASDGDLALACAIVASKASCPLFCAERVLDRAANVPFTTNEALLVSLAVDIGHDDVSASGGASLIADAVAMAVEQPVDPAECLRQTSHSFRALVEKQGYAVVALGGAIETADRRALTALLKDLREASSIVPLIWPLHRATAKRLEALGLRTLLKGERVVVLGLLGYPEYVGLVKGARGVLTNSRNVLAEARALAVPCLSIGDSSPPLARGGAANDPVDPRAYSKEGVQAWAPADGRRVAPGATDSTADAGARIAGQIVEWLVQQGDVPPSNVRQIGH
jgi:general secretion pathway protein A